MIKMVMTLKRREGMTHDEFAHYQRNVHRPLLMSVPDGRNVVQKSERVGVGGCGEEFRPPHPLHTALGDGVFHAGHLTEPCGRHRLPYSP